MEQGEFRKLDIDLPREPTTNEYPWLIAGFILAILFLLFSAVVYLEN